MQLLAHDATSGITTRDPVLLDRVLDTAFQSPTVLYASVSDLQGEIARRTAPSRADAGALLPARDASIPEYEIQACLESPGSTVGPPTAR